MLSLSVCTKGSLNCNLTRYHREKLSVFGTFQVLVEISVPTLALQKIGGGSVGKSDVFPRKVVLGNEVAYPKMLSRGIFCSSCPRCIGVMINLHLAGGGF